MKMVRNSNASTDLSPRFLVRQNTLQNTIKSLNMSKKAVVRFGSDGSSLIIPFESGDTVSKFIQKIADERNTDVKQLSIVFRSKQYHGNQINNQTVEFIGMNDKSQILVTTRFHGGLNMLLVYVIKC